MVFPCWLASVTSEQNNNLRGVNLSRFLMDDTLNRKLRPSDAYDFKRQYDTSDKIQAITHEDAIDDLVEELALRKCDDKPR